jgi:predicted membrane protein
MVSECIKVVAILVFLVFLGHFCSSFLFEPLNFVAIVVLLWLSASVSSTNSCASSLIFMAVVMMVR